MLSSTSHQDIQDKGGIQSVRVLMRVVTVFIPNSSRATLLLLTLLLQILAETQSAAAGPRPGIIDSGIYVDALFTPYWVNNEQIFFRGFDRAKPKDVIEAKQLRHTLYLWSIDRDPQPYALGLWPGAASPAWHCAADGQVWFAVRPESESSRGGGASHQLVGRPGAETLRPRKPYGREQPVNRSRDNCDRDYPASMSSRVWAVDAFNDYYIDFGGRPSSATTAQVVLKRLRGGNEVPLPIAPDKVRPSCTQFFRFSQVFLVWDCHEPSSPSGIERWRADGCLPLWLVTPSSASTEITCLPYGAWQGPIGSMVLTKSGLFFTSLHRGGPRSPDPGVAGLYQLTSIPRQILSGVASNATVSPDGCKIAFSYAPRFSALNYGTAGSDTLVVLKVCQ